MYVFFCGWWRSLYSGFLIAYGSSSQRLYDNLRFSLLITGLVSFKLPRGTPLVSQMFFTYGFFYRHNCAYCIIKAVIGTLSWSPHYSPTFPPFKPGHLHHFHAPALLTIMTERSEFAGFWWRPAVLFFFSVCLTEYVAATHPRTLSCLLSASLMPHTLDLKTTWACLEMCLILPPTQTPMRVSFVKTMDAKNISSIRGWDHSGGEWSQETCLHVLTKQNQTRRATELWMKQSRHRSRPVIHLSFNRKCPITWKLRQKHMRVQDTGRKITYI